MTEEDEQMIADFQASIDGLSDEEVLALALTSPAIHFATCVSIKDKDNRVIENPTPNILQLRLSSTYETLRELGGKIRIITVKPRQVGCSSFVSHIVYHHAMRFPVEGLTISDIKAHSKDLMDKVRDYGRVDRFPWGHRMTGDTTKSLAWDNETTWEIDSAENPNAGIGGTRQVGHFSEVSKWPKTDKKNDKSTMGAVLPSFSGDDTVVFAESTPEGATGWMFETWQGAVTLEQYLDLREKGLAPEECWVKVFAAWFEFDFHRRKTPVSEQEIHWFQRTMSQREREGIDKYGWDWEQIGWRRDTIKSVCNGSENLFDEYYPEDDVRCWTSSGRPRFDMTRLVEMEIRAKQAVADSGHLVTQDNGVVSWSPRADGNGDIRVWERPREGLRYVVCVDPATGSSQTVGADPDRNSIQVWRARYHDRSTDRVMPAMLVARVVSPFYGDDDETAGHAVRLAKWYGQAIVALEVNQGLQVLRLLKDAGVHLYKRIVTSHRTSSEVEQYGFKLTDAEQRRQVVEGLAAAIRSSEIEVFCVDWLREAKAFVTKPNGKAEAASGEHDDDVMAGAMAWEVLPSASEYRRAAAKQVDPADRKTWKRVSAVKRGW